MRLQVCIQRRQLQAVQVAQPLSAVVLLARQTVGPNIQVSTMLHAIRVALVSKVSMTNHAIRVAMVCLSYAMGITLVLLARQRICPSIQVSKVSMTSHAIRVAMDFLRRRIIGSIIQVCISHAMGITLVLLARQRICPSIQVPMMLHAMGVAMVLLTRQRIRPSIQVIPMPTCHSPNGPAGPRSIRCQEHPGPASAARRILHTSTPPIIMRTPCSFQDLHPRSLAVSLLRHGRRAKARETDAAAEERQITRRRLLLPRKGSR
mmetsp:Transcript_45142/g.100962  ORF Transcript_45142/g.100962 Transcript_45142/m.100962 type:complete len:262 (-) Transcript_45142:971-1756(-)